MSDILKCPYCGGILEQSSIFNLNSYTCTNLTCNGYNMNATKDIWQELICTRKALDVAMAGLEKMTWGCDSSDAEHLLKQIKEITALNKIKDKEQQ